jgi:putative transposase
VTEVKTEQASEAAAADLAVMDEQIQQLADRARAQGLRLTGEGGLLGRLTKLVTEAALAGEMDHPSRLRQARPGWPRRRQLA